MTDWKQINFNVWVKNTDKAEYIFQEYREPNEFMDDTVTHSAKLKSDVLIINNKPPIKVNGIEEANKLISDSSTPSSIRGTE